jgi:hypothetical protein
MTQKDFFDDVRKPDGTLDWAAPAGRWRIFRKCLKTEGTETTEGDAR